MRAPGITLYYARAAAESVSEAANGMMQKCLCRIAQKCLAKFIIEILLLMRPWHNIRHAAATVAAAPPNIYMFLC